MHLIGQSLLLLFGEIEGTFEDCECLFCLEHTASCDVDLYVMENGIILQYCNVVWDPHQEKSLQNKLEAVEKFALRVCLKAWGMPYDDLIARAEIKSLESRRKISKLMFIFKILYKLLFKLCRMIYSPRAHLVDQIIRITH